MSSFLSHGAYFAQSRGGGAAFLMITRLVNYDARRSRCHEASDALAALEIGPAGMRLLWPGTQVKTLANGIESSMKDESDNIYRVDVVAIGALLQGS